MLKFKKIKLDIDVFLKKKIEIMCSFVVVKQVLNLEV